MQNTDRIYDLGLCVPGKKGIELTKRVPLRLFENEEFIFYLCKQNNEHFYPIEPQMPFEHLAMLRVSRFQIRDGIPGVLVGNHRVISNPTGQWSEPIISE